jgi:hypothetical protein
MATRVGQKQGWGAHELRRGGWWAVVGRPESPVLFSFNSKF